MVANVSLSLHYVTPRSRRHRQTRWRKHTGSSRISVPPCGVRGAQTDEGSDNKAHPCANGLQGLRMRQRAVAPRRSTMRLRNLQAQGYETCVLKRVTTHALSERRSSVSLLGAALFEHSRRVLSERRSSVCLLGAV
ncbi:hypothetical protein NDU88_008319 [Pleurodeles waltl]|uniref:Uncharacterized protein n=1 Tax=Pleurodeles waltl TaxID=8319 RepID=A0AAV7U441_PLEWA|nr:hypothetical protein NDU88_008319 [Pleurodeles waltl]